MQLFPDASESLSPLRARFVTANQFTSEILTAACLSRRRWTEDGIRMASRYLATVRRAILMPASRKCSTIVSSDIMSCTDSASTSCLMRYRTASAECASPPFVDAIADVKKNFISKVPRAAAIYLLAVTRETVDSCIPIASATVLRFSGRDRNARVDGLACHG